MNYLTTISEREREVLEQLSRGLSSQELASHLYLSCETVRSHRKNLMAKLDARNAAHLVRLAFERNLLSLEKN